MKKIIRIVVLCLVGGLIIVAIASSSATKPTTAEQVWDERATVGSLEAKNYYIMYTDIMCPYCDVFTREAIENEEAFNKFVEDNNVLFEVRVTDMLYDSVGSEYSRESAVATYCAKNKDKFFEYYHAAVMQLYEDYHSKGIGDSKTSPQIKDLPENYWVEIGKNIGLGEGFENCYKNSETLDEVIKNTTKAEKFASGLPYFDLNGEGVAGYDASWGWETLMKAGLKK